MVRFFGPPCINGMAVGHRVMWPTSHTVLLAWLSAIKPCGPQAIQYFWLMSASITFWHLWNTAWDCRPIDKITLEWQPTLSATNNGPCSTAFTLFTVLPRPSCEWNICFVICESSSRKRLMSNRSVSGTSQVEMLPDVVPDQRRLIEEESTEVGAVCMSIHSHFCIFCFVEEYLVTPF